MKIDKKKIKEMAGGTIILRKINVAHDDELWQNATSQLTMYLGFKTKEEKQ